MAECHGDSQLGPLGAGAPDSPAAPFVFLVARLWARMLSHSRLIDSRQQRGRLWQWRVGDMEWAGGQ